MDIILLLSKRFAMLLRVFFNFAVDKTSYKTSLYQNNSVTLQTEKQENDVPNKHKYNPEI